MSKIRLLVPLDSCADEIVWAYEISKDEARRERLSEAYEKLTGQDIERRLAVMND